MNHSNHLRVNQSKTVAARRILTVLSLVLLSIAFLSGCQRVDNLPTSSEAQVTESQALAETLQVEPETQAIQEPVLKAYASIYPLYDFTKRLGGGRVAVHMVIPAGIDAHDFEPTAKQVGEISDSDLFVYNGLGLEHWAENFIAQLPSEVTVVETSKGVAVHTMEEALAGEDHDHDHDHDHEDEATAGDGHNHEGGYDPHIWTDPNKALEQASHILNALIQKDPEGEALYRENFEGLKADFLALDQAYAAALKDFKQRKIVVGHASFAYMAERYQLTQLAISGISPMEEPSAAALGKLTKLIKTHGVKVIFYETLASPKFSEVLAKETGTKTAVLHSLESLTQAEIDQGMDYFKIMYQNLEALKLALGQ